jgi:hypothetical protein
MPGGQDSQSGHDAESHQIRVFRPGMMLKGNTSLSTE